jgi:hypothetical protein
MNTKSIFMEHQHQDQKYSCPMHPEVISDTPGKCPKCAMNLVPIQASKEYYCPMHCEGDKTYSQPGKCPVCGMNLKAA